MTPKQALAKAQKLWYEKIKRHGFEDIEQDEFTLKLSSTQFFYGTKNGVRYNEKMASYESKVEYYRLAEHFLHSYKFGSKLEKKIWAMHAEGKSYRDISKSLNSEKFLLNKDKVQIIITKLKDEMIRLNRSEQNEQE